MHWLDFKPRRERFAEALRTLVRALFRDVESAEEQLEKALAETPDFGAPKPSGKPRSGPKKPGKG
jgi:hypothetical protein